MSAKDRLKGIGIDTSSKIEGTVFTWGQALKLARINAFAIPNPQQQENIIRQAHALQPVYNLLGGFVITSWLRTPQYNILIGGAAKSIHLTGLATDFVPLKGTPDEARAKIRDAGIYVGRTELDAKTWCHYDLSGKKDFYGRPKV